MTAARRQRVSAAALRRLQQSLSERDLAILASLAECRFLTARQIQRWHFPMDPVHHTPGGADRVARRVLARHVRDRLLVRLRRQIGGVRAGSSGYVYALGPVGQRVLELPGPRRRVEEPSTRFLDHTLAVADIVVGLVEADRAKDADLLECETEPRCWRQFSRGSAVETLKPDLRLTLGAGSQERHWFLEVDRGTAHLPTLMGKCHRYVAYYQTGREQAAAGVFPQVAWLTTTERIARLREAITTEPRLPDALFVVAADEEWRPLLLGRGGST